MALTHLDFTMLDVCILSNKLKADCWDLFFFFSPTQAKEAAIMLTALREIFPVTEAERPVNYSKVILQMLPELTAKNLLA